MKKLFFPFLLLASLVAGASQPMALDDGPKHVEFKYYGFYCVIDYTHMMCLSHQTGQYLDPTSGSIVYTNDKYNLNGISGVVGWQWRKESALGVGFSYLNDASGSFSQIPVFVEFRSHFLRNRVTPFTAVQLGYSIPFGTKNKVAEYTKIDEGGITFGIQAGARFAISPKLGINIYAGYQLIHINSLERGFNEVATSRSSELFNNVKFGLGVNF